MSERNIEKKLRYFVKDNGRQLPVDDNRYLLPFMLPTSARTQLRDGPPEGDLQDHQKGRILLQTHQFLHLFQEYGISLEGKSLLDVGTGNGMIPRMLLEYSGLESAVGSDPYLDGELPVSWQVHDHDRAFQELKSFIGSCCRKRFAFRTYKHLLHYENFSMRPGDVSIKPAGGKKYRFAKVGAHALENLNETFDVIYAKAIEHISNWQGVFQSLRAVSHADTVLYLKHRSFFSYLGAHRRSSIGIPWGQLLLTDGEYSRFVDEYYPDDAARMKSFYFEGLTYPRTTVSDMVRIARDYGFVPIVFICEPTRYINTVVQFIDEVDGFWKMVEENHPGVGADEIFSGIYHVLFSIKS